MVNLFIWVQNEAAVLEQSIQVVPVGIVSKVGVVVGSSAAHFFAEVVKYMGLFFLGSIVVISLLISC